MTASREAIYWKSNPEWYRWNEEKKEYELTENAPQRAIESFEIWCGKSNKIAIR